MFLHVFLTDLLLNGFFQFFKILFFTDSLCYKNNMKAKISFDRSLISPGSMLNAASSKGGTMLPLGNIPRSPPSVDEGHME